MIVEYRLEGKRKMRIFLTLFIVVAFLASCKGSHASSSAEGEGEVLPMKYA